MGTIASAFDNIIIKDQRDSKGSYKNGSTVEVDENNPVFERAAPEISENFSDYLDYLQLEKDPKLMMLSSAHYYYEIEDLKTVKILVNLKQLNQIKQTTDFLNNIKHILPLRSYFVGRFFDNQIQSGFLSDPHKPQRYTAGHFDPVAKRNLIEESFYKYAV